ncbi:MAG TPA: hypothetical protein VHU82_08945 [Vicinamibacterales bacterium]|nr:hypothetical protein [Vicinamibacterales bacterium]
MILAGLLVASLMLYAQQAPEAQPPQHAQPAQQPQETQPPPDAPPPLDLPVSLDRVRAGLARPDRLTLQPIAADFSVHIDERERFDKLVPPVDYRSGPVPPGGLYAYEQLQRSGLTQPQPLFLVDLIAIGRGIAHAHAAHSAAAAREDVRRAIDAYCADQPDGGAGIAICGK